MVGFWARPLAFMDRCRERYGKRFTIRLPFTPPFVMIADPEQLKQIFTAAPDVLHPGEGAKVLELLGTCELGDAGEGVEAAQRRNITVRPVRGARVAAAERERVARAG